MKPCLVDLSDFLNKDKSPRSEIKIKRIKDVKIDKNLNIKIIFNLFGLISIIIGIVFLIKRKEKKEEKRKLLKDKIEKLSKIIENQ